MCSCPGTFRRLPQDRAAANYWRKRGKADGVIDWRMSADRIQTLVRALSKPYVGAQFAHDDREIKVWASTAVPFPERNIESGKVLSLERGVLVKCGSDTILLRKCEPAFATRIAAYLRTCSS
jgi:methionyl-tRNA formyltransferase